MLIRILNGLLATATLALLGACSTPCDAPGGLCAPLKANTSVPTRAPAPLAAPAPSAVVETMPVDAPGAAVPAGAPPVRIGLLLPLRSDALGAPSSALRAGFLAAWERDRSGFTVNVIETGDAPGDALDAYMAALKDNDIIVGPLARSAVGAIAFSGAVNKPTIALNHPDGKSGDVLPPNLLVVGLSIEDEARQVRSIVGTALTTFGTSSVNPGTGQASALVDLDGTRLLDMPWEVHPEHAAVMVYPRYLGSTRSLDHDRLYALGIDAFRIARQVALKPNTPFKMDGVTGRLSVDFGQGRAHFSRFQSGAVYQGGAFKLVDPVR
jgi:outer membrane PBP1 activator LpoA protein